MDPWDNHLKGNDSSPINSVLFNKTIKYQTLVGKQKVLSSMDCNKIQFEEVQFRAPGNEKTGVLSPHKGFLEFFRGLVEI